MSYNSILTLFAWRLHQIPQSKGSVTHNCSLLQRLITSSGSPGHLQLLSDLATHQRFLWASPHLGLDYLLIQLTELRETFTFIYQFTKEYDKRLRWTDEIHRARSRSVPSKGASVPVKVRCITPQHMDVHTNLEVFWFWHYSLDLTPSLGISTSHWFGPRKQKHLKKKKKEFSWQTVWSQWTTLLILTIGQFRPWCGLAPKVRPILCRQSGI